MSIRKAGEALTAIRELLEAAVVSDVARGRQVAYGHLTYRNIPELVEDAKRYIEAQGIRPTPGNIRATAKELIEQMKSQYSELVGIEFDERGVPYQQGNHMPNTPTAPLESGRVAPLDQDDPYWDTPF